MKHNKEELKTENGEKLPIEKRLAAAAGKRRMTVSALDPIIESAKLLSLAPNKS